MKDGIIKPSKAWGTSTWSSEIKEGLAFWQQVKTDYGTKTIVNFLENGSKEWIHLSPEHAHTIRDFAIDKSIKEVDAYLKFNEKQIAEYSGNIAKLTDELSKLKKLKK